MQDLLVWAARWHYPRLVLDAEQSIPHGEVAWREFAKHASSEQEAQAWQRINRWNALTEEVA